MKRAGKFLIIKIKRLEVKKKISCVGLSSRRLRKDSVEEFHYLLKIVVKREMEGKFTISTCNKLMKVLGNGDN